MRYCLLSGLVEKPISGEWGTGEGQVSVIRAANFTNHGRINFSKVIGRAIVEKKVIAKKLDIDDIIIEKSGGSPTQPVGRVVFFEQGGTYLCNNFTSILRPIKQHVFPKYLHYILFCNHKYGFVCKFQNKTTGIINLQLAKYLQGTKIPLPPLAEQKKIAAILDAADELRQKYAQLIAKYNELSQSLFLDMFGDPVSWSDNKISTDWQKKKMRDISLLKRGYDLPVQSRKEGNVDIYAANGVVGKHNEAKVKGCGVITGRSGTIGKVSFTQNDFWPLNTSLYVVNFHGNNPTYIYHFLTFYKLDRYVQGAGVPTLNRNLFLNEWSYVPSITLQNQFSERIQHVEAQKQQAQAALQKSDDLFHSLLQRAFKGELTGKEVNA